MRDTQRVATDTHPDHKTQVIHCDAYPCLSMMLEWGEAEQSGHIHSKKPEIHLGGE